MPQWSKKSPWAFPSDWNSFGPTKVVFVFLPRGVVLGVGAWRAEGCLLALEDVERRVVIQKTNIFADILTWMMLKEGIVI